MEKTLVGEEDRLVKLSKDIYPMKYYKSSVDKKQCVCRFSWQSHGQSFHIFFSRLMDAKIKKKIPIRTP